MDGIINIYKPKEWTSHDIVAKIKRITGEKVGHTGTLDPLAQGVLPILIGKGTQCSKYLVNHDKKYRVELKLGKRTETLDAEGKIIEEKEIPQNMLEQSNKSNIEKTLKTFEGEIEQKPPIYSAIKVKGKKLYEYARKGQEVEIPTRKITIYSIELKQIKKEKNIIIFDVYCSKGTYIRTLCEDIAKKLNTIGYMQNLLRIQVGEFNIKDSITLIMENKTDLENIEKNIITIEKIFSKHPKVNIEQSKIKYFLNGVKITKNLEDGIYRIYTNNKFIGTGTIKEKLLKRDIII
ncbi:MAG: tRNA pseudouridine(55) synthase TruB [Clostridium sp. 27_14]|nr:MAG: tRNA pseudouridine(55) synthase TruB [Clostridium sp. 27_14]